MQIYKNIGAHMHKIKKILDFRRILMYINYLSLINIIKPSFGS